MYNDIWNIETQKENNEIGTQWPHYMGKHDSIEKMLCASSMHTIVNACNESAYVACGIAQTGERNTLWHGLYQKVAMAHLWGFSLVWS